MKAHTPTPRTDQPVPVSVLAPDLEPERLPPGRQLVPPQTDSGFPTGSAARGAIEPGRNVDLRERDDRPVEERIAERAYFLYLARNGQEGDELGDWLEAERQINEERAIYG
jgi:hypothetical protein